MSAKKIQIIEDVPLPRTRGKYPFSDLDVGDGFVVEVEEDGSRKTQSNLATLARRFAKRDGRDKQFVTRIDPDKRRVWVKRIA